MKKMNNLYFLLFGIFNSIIINTAYQPLPTARTNHYASFHYLHNKDTNQKTTSTNSVNALESKNFSPLSRYIKSAPSRAERQTRERAEQERLYKRQQS